MAIRAQDGATIPGGCDHCDAYQIVNADKFGPNLHQIAIHHDDWCPVLAHHQGRTP
jgi:cytochrome c2